VVLEATHVAASIGDLDGSRLLWQERYQLRSILESEQDCESTVTFDGASC
jgi:hypothetical protein